MEDRIHLQVLTVAQVVYDGMVSYVQLPLEGGSIGVLHGHAPLLGAVTEGVIKFTRQGTDGYLASARGVAHVTGEAVTVLADAAEPAEAIDLARAQAAERRAREWLGRHTPEADTVRAEAALHRAMARQTAVRLLKKK